MVFISYDDVKFVCLSKLTTCGIYYLLNNGAIFLFMFITKCEYIW